MCLNLYFKVIRDIRSLRGKHQAAKIKLTRLSCKNLVKQPEEEDYLWESKSIYLYKVRSQAADVASLE